MTFRAAASYWILLVPLVTMGYFLSTRLLPIRPSNLPRIKRRDSLVRRGFWILGTASAVTAALALFVDGWLLTPLLLSAEYLLGALLLARWPIRA